MTKTEFVMKKLKKRILSGEFRSGQKLPSMRDLGNAYGVSTMVLRKVVEQLEKEGLVESSNRSGLFIPENLKQHELCGVINSILMGTMENYFEALLQCASKYNSVPMIVPPIDTSMESMLEKDPRRVYICTSAEALPYEKLQHITAGKNIIFCNQYEWQAGKPESAVLADWDAITELTLKAFLDAGHERILFVSYNQELPEFKQRQFRKAAKKLGLELGSPEFQWCSLEDFENNHSKIRTIFRENPAPTAAFSRGDSLLYLLKEQLHIHFPMYADMDFIGTYNSFWSNHTGQEFASWEWDWDMFWEMVFNHKDKGVEYYLPNLVKWNPKKRKTQ